MTQELQKVEQYQPIQTQITDELLDKYLVSMGNKLQPEQRNQFVQLAKAFNLNPFTREIYGIAYGNNFNIIVGYEVYLKRAERSGMLAGWRAWTEGNGQSLRACVEIKRKDWESPFYHEVYIDEYDQKNNMWKSKPRTMLKKVAIAQGFRMAFSVELGGIPYTADELPSEPTDVTPKNTQQSTPKPKEQLHPVVEQLNQKIKASGVNAKDFVEFTSLERDNIEVCQKVLNDFDFYLAQFKDSRVIQHETV